MKEQKGCCFNKLKCRKVNLVISTLMPLYNYLTIIPHCAKSGTSGFRQQRAPFHYFTDDEPC